MSAIWEIFRHPIAERIGWILLHSLWQGALIGAGFALLRFALRKQSAQTRYLTGCFCLMLLVSAPFVTLLMAPLPRFEESVGFSDSLYSVPSASTQGATLAPAYSGESWIIGVIESTVAFLGQLTPWLTAAWLCGVLISSCKLIRGFWWVQAIRRKEVETVSADLLEGFDGLRRRLSISQPVRLLKSALVEVPTVVGWFRPVILLPASSLLGLTPGQLEAILVHELAHVRRFDYVVNASQCLIETLMFYHPVVWWISRCIRDEREHCCDDYVVKVCGNRVAYARALATLEGLRDPIPQLAFAASGGTLLNRVRRLLGAPNAEESIGFRQIGGLALLGIGLLFILSGIYLNLQTPVYRAMTRIKVERETSAAQVGSENGKFTFTVWDPYFVQNVCEEIRSETILLKVIENLWLSEHAKRAESAKLLQKNGELINKLRRRVDCRPVRSTMFFEISCISEKPEEAKAIANEVVKAYRQFRLERLEHGNFGNVRALEERLREQEERVHKAQSEVDRLRADYNISDSMSAAGSPPMLMSAEMLRKLEGMRIELDSQIMREETLLASYKGLPREKLINVLPTTAPDAALNTMLEQRTLCEQALVVKRQEYGEQHLEVLKLQSQVKDLQSKIDDRLDGILIGTESRLNSQKEQLKKLKEEVEIAKAQDIATAKITQPYWEAKRKLEELQRFSQVLTTKILSETIEATLPKKALVEIMDDAGTPQRPIYPNRPKAGAMIVFGILLDLGGMRIIRGRPRLIPVLQPS